MAMNIEDFKALGAEALTAASTQTEAGVDVGLISDRLSKMADAFVAATAENTQLRTVNSDLTTKNESLRETNMGLFLQIGEVGKQQQMTQQGTLKSRSETITIDDLFDPSGKLI